MSQEKIEFIGIPSGDGECFGWEVDHETWKSLEDPEEIELAARHREDAIALGQNPVPPEEQRHLINADILLLNRLQHYAYLHSGTTKRRYRVTMQIERIDDAE